MSYYPYGLNKSFYQKRYNLNLFVKKIQNEENPFMTTINNACHNFLVSEAGISNAKANKIISKRPYSINNLAEKICPLDYVSVSTLESILTSSNKFCNNDYNFYNDYNGVTVEKINNVCKKETFYSISGIGPVRAINIYNHILNGGFQKNIDLEFQLKHIPEIGARNAKNIVNYFKNN